MEAKNQLKFTRYNLTWIVTPDRIEVNNHDFCGEFDYTPKRSHSIPHELDYTKIERVWGNPLFFFFDSVTQHFNFEAFGAKEKTCDTDCPITNLMTETENIHIRVSDEIALIYLHKFHDYIAFAIKVYYPTIPAPIYRTASLSSQQLDVSVCPVELEPPLVGQSKLQWMLGDSDPDSD